MESFLTGPYHTGVNAFGAEERS